MSCGFRGRMRNSTKIENYLNTLVCSTSHSNMQLVWINLKEYLINRHSLKHFHKNLFMKPSAVGRFRWQYQFLVLKYLKISKWEEYVWHRSKVARAKFLPNCENKFRLIQISRHFWVVVLHHSSSFAVVLLFLLLSMFLQSAEQILFWTFSLLSSANALKKSSSWSSTTDSHCVNKTKSRLRQVL